MNSFFHILQNRNVQHDTFLESTINSPLTCSSGCWGNRLWKKFLYCDICYTWRKKLIKKIFFPTTHAMSNFFFCFQNLVLSIMHTSLFILARSHKPKRFYYVFKITPSNYLKHDLWSPWGLPAKIELRNNLLSDSKAWYLFGISDKFARNGFLRIFLIGVESVLRRLLINRMNLYGYANNMYGSRYMLIRFNLHLLRKPRASFVY